VECSATPGSRSAHIRSQPRSGDTIPIALMPNTYTQLLYHVVFSTKNRQRKLLDEYRRLLAESGISFDERYLT
jgi:hypothetical protein